MEEPLRVLVSVDTRKAAASIEVRGALTGANCATLLNILHHTAALGASILVNLSRAVRIEAAALDVLTDVARTVERSAASAPGLRVAVQLPPADPPSASRTRTAPHRNRPLDNEQALEMILQRDSRVLSDRRAGTRTRGSTPHRAGSR